MNLDLSAQIAVIATFAALASALGSVLTLVRLRRAEQAGFFLTMADRYNCAEMLLALRQIVKFYKTNPENFVERWLELMRTQTPEAEELEAHRRRINRHFLNIAQLYRAGYIDSKLAHLTANVAGVNVWYEIVIPLSMVTFPTTMESLEALRKILPRFSDGPMIMDTASGHPAAPSR